MKSIDLRHRLAAVLLAVCLVVCCALPAFATSANIVLGRLGSLHVRLYDTHNDVPLRGGELTIRKDDAPETVKARLDVYHAETEPLKDFYAQRGKLVSVDNQPTIEATTAAIEKALGLE